MPPPLLAAAAPLFKRTVLAVLDISDNPIGAFPATVAFGASVLVLLAENASLGGLDPAVMRVMVLRNNSLSSLPPAVRRQLDFGPRMDVVDLANNSFVTLDGVGRAQPLWPNGSGLCGAARLFLGGNPWRCPYPCAAMLDPVTSACATTTPVMREPGLLQSTQFASFFREALLPRVQALRPQPAVSSLLL